MIFYVIIFLGILSVASASILIKMCAAPAMVIAAYRLGFAASFFVLAALMRRTNPFAAFSRRDFKLAAFAGLFLSIHFSTWISSLKYISVANSVVLLATTPVFVGIASMFFLKERLNKALAAGIALTLVGAAIIGVNGFGSNHFSLIGNILALLGAIGAGGYFMIGRALRGRIDTFSYVTVVYCFTALVLLSVTFAFGFSFLHYERSEYLLFFLIAFVPQVVGHTSFNWALKHVSAATVSVISLGEPIGAPILAFFILGEKITAIQLFGGILILAGVVSALRGEFVPKR